MKSAKCRSEPRPSCLRVLEDHKLRRLGSKVETSVDVRVLAATNKVPDEAVASGELRSDLYYRLNVFNIHMPPLREHKEDIPDLVQLASCRDELQTSRKVAAVSEAVMNSSTTIHGRETCANCATPSSARSSYATAA